MVVIGILIAVALALFFGAFITKRRFGLLGLALTAGATLSTLWSDTAGLMLSATGLVPDGPMTTAVALSAVVLLPAILLLFHGYTYKSMFGRIVGSLLFTALAFTFLLEPIQYILPLEGVAATVFTTLLSQKDIIISVGVVFAIIDLFLTKPVKDRDKRH